MIFWRYDKDLKKLDCRRVEGFAECHSGGQTLIFVRALAQECLDFETKWGVKNSKLSAGEKLCKKTELHDLPVPVRIKSPYFNHSLCRNMWFLESRTCQTCQSLLTRAQKRPGKLARVRRWKKTRYTKILMKRPTRWWASPMSKPDAKMAPVSKLPYPKEGSIY